MELGQINRGSTFGEFIYNICKKPDVKSVVEVGTWNGLGTTKCIYDAIIDSQKTDCVVLSLECDIKFYQRAINNLPRIPNFNYIWGKLVELEELVSIDDYDDSFFIGADREEQNRWRNADIENYKNAPNVFKWVPNEIDVLVLDGGEFSTRKEFEKLKDRPRYILLDDTKIIKNYINANILRNDKNFEILIDSDDRNGFLIAKRI